MKKPRIVIPSVLLLSVCGLVVTIAWSQVPEKSTPAKAETAGGFRDLEAVLLLIEKDVPIKEKAIGFGNYKAALKGLLQTYEQQARAGDKEAQFKVGAMYLEGLGVNPSPAAAMRWFTMAGGPTHPFVHLAQAKFYQRNRERREDRKLREHTIEALGKIGPASEAAIPILEQEIGNGGQLGRAAAIALGRIGEPGITILIEALASKDVVRRRAAAEGLSQVGSAARRAIPQLTAALDDEDPETRKYADWALQRARTEEGAK